MHTPWHNRTGIPKAIAIVSTIGILAFGLCTVNVLTSGASGDNWFAEIQTGIVRVCAPAVLVSLIVIAVLLFINAVRRPGSKDD